MASSITPSINQLSINQSTSQFRNCPIAYCGESSHSRWNNACSYSSLRWSVVVITRSKAASLDLPFAVSLLSVIARVILLTVDLVTFTHEMFLLSLPVGSQLVIVRWSAFSHLILTVPRDITDCCELVTWCSQRRYPDKNDWAEYSQEHQQNMWRSQVKMELAFRGWKWTINAFDRDLQYTWMIFLIRIP